MKYSNRFLDSVARYEWLMEPAVCEKTDIGLGQFFLFESRGIKPDSPDKYFSFLLDGKKWWEWTLNFYKERYEADDWPGWFQLAQDFKDDPQGFVQLRQRIGFEPLTPEQYFLKEACYV